MSTTQSTMTICAPIPFFKFIFHFFKMFGVATMAIDSDFDFEASKPGIAYNVLLIILVLIGTYFGINLAYFIDFAERGQLERIADTIHILILIFTTLFILIIHCVRQEKIIKIAKDLRRLTDMSSSLCCKKTHQERSNVVVGELKLIILLNVLATSIFIATTPTSPVGIFLCFVSMTICNLIINTLIMQYTIVITLITHLFAVLNTSLVEITTQKAKQFEISFMEKYGLQMKLSKLSHCREFFISLRRLSQQISKFMEMMILACITNVFITLIMYSYYTMKPFVVERNVIPPSVIIHGVTQLGLTIVTTVLLAKAGSWAINQSKQTGEIVNECMQNEGFLCHPDVANQLQLFSNYLLHTNVRFGVCHLFTLDETLLMSIAGSITTYLVILLQFKQSNTT